MWKRHWYDLVRNCRYFIRCATMLKVIFVAMETNRLCLSSTVQDVLHEQGHPKDCSIGLQSAATAQAAQTELQITMKSQSMGEFNDALKKTKQTKLCSWLRLFVLFESRLVKPI